MTFSRPERKSMLRFLGSTASAVAVAAVLATTSPASAQLADVEIEGPMMSISLTPEGALPPELGAPGGTVIGTIKVMGVDVKVRSDALIHTPTNDNLSLENGITDTSAGLSKLAIGPMPGRAEQGFIGGTAIVIGDSLNGVFYARDVFSDLFENVVVGEATGVVQTTTGVERITLQGMELIRSKDPRMPAAPPINGFGFQIKPSTIVAGTLLSAEGYFSKSRDTLYYHTLEADSAELTRPDKTEVSMLRADCRIRGRARDEISVRGGIHFPAGVTPTNDQVVIQMPNPAVSQPDPANPNHWVNVGISDPAVFDNTLSPPQATYDFDGDDLNLGTCPGLLRAQYQGPERKAAYATFAPDIR
jgi:hypothetical protein